MSDIGDGGIRVGGGLEDLTKVQHNMAAVSVFGGSIKTRRIIINELLSVNDVPCWVESGKSSVACCVSDNTTFNKYNEEFKISILDTRGIINNTLQSSTQTLFKILMEMSSAVVIGISTSPASTLKWISSAAGSSIVKDVSKPQLMFVCESGTVQLELKSLLQSNRQILHSLFSTVFCVTPDIVSEIRLRLRVRNGIQDVNQIVSSLLGRDIVNEGGYSCYSSPVQAALQLYKSTMDADSEEKAFKYLTCKTLEQSHHSALRRAISVEALQHKGKQRKSSKRHCVSLIETLCIPIDSQTATCSYNSWEDWNSQLLQLLSNYKSQAKGPEQWHVLVSMLEDWCLPNCAAVHMMLCDKIKQQECIKDYTYLEDVVARMKSEGERLREEAVRINSTAMNQSILSECLGKSSEDASRWQQHAEQIRSRYSELEGKLSSERTEHLAAMNREIHNSDLHIRKIKSLNSITNTLRASLNEHNIPTDDINSNSPVGSTVQSPRSVSTIAQLSATNSILTTTVKELESKIVQQTKIEQTLKAQQQSENQLQKVLSAIQDGNLQPKATVDIPDCIAQELKHIKDQLPTTEIVSRLTSEKASLEVKLAQKTNKLKNLESEHTDTMSKMEDLNGSLLASEAARIELDDLVISLKKQFGDVSEKLDEAESSRRAERTSKNEVEQHLDKKLESESSRVRELTTAVASSKASETAAIIAREAANSERQKYEVLCSSLTTDVSKLQSEMELSATKLSDSRNEVTTLKIRLETSQDNNKQLEYAAAGLRTEISNEKQTKIEGVESLREQITVATTSRSEALTKVAQLEAEKIHFESIKQSLEREKDRLLKELNCLQTETENVNNKRRDDVVQLRQELADMTTKKAGLESALETERVVLKGEITSLRESLSTQQSKYDVTMTERAALSRDCASHKATADALQEHITTSTKQFETAMSSIKKLHREEQSNTASYVTDMNLFKDAAENAQKRLERQREEDQNKIRHLQTKIEDLQLQAVSLKCEADSQLEISADLDIARSELNVKNDELRNIHTKCEVLTIQLSNFEEQVQLTGNRDSELVKLHNSQLEGLKNQLETVSGNLSTTQSQNNDLRNRVSELLSKETILEARIKELTSGEVVLKNEIEEMNQNHNTTNQHNTTEIRKQKGLLSSVNQENERLRSVIKQKEIDKVVFDQSVKAEMETLKTENRELERQIQHLQCCEDDKKNQIRKLEEKIASDKRKQRTENLTRVVTELKDSRGRSANTPTEDSDSVSPTPLTTFSLVTSATSRPQPRKLSTPRPGTSRSRSVSPSIVVSDLAGLTSVRHST